MVFHVGIDAKSGEVEAYNDETKRTIKFETGVVLSSFYDKIESVDDLFKIIKSKLMGDLGYICFSMHDRTRNNIRQECIKKGKEYGFRNALIINSITELYLACFLNFKKKPNVGDIIWTFIRNKYVIWEKTDTYAKLIKILYYYLFKPITENDLLEMRKDSGVDKNPNFIVSNTGGYKHFSEIVKSTFPDCKFVLHKSTFETCEIALIKARIAADDPNLDSDIKMCDIDNYIYEKIRISVSSFPYIIQNLEEGQLLPFKKSLTIPLKDDEKFKEISWDIGDRTDWVKMEVTPEMSKVGKITVVIKIDENGVILCDLKFKALENKETRIKKIYESQSKLEPEKFKIPKKELINNPNINAVGIDLGMTRCCVSVNRKDRYELVAIDNIERQLPSYISFKEKEPICGQLVINQLQFYANSTVFDIKLLIGKNFDEIEKHSSWPFEIIKSQNDKPKIHVQGCESALKKHPEEALAILLKHIKQKVEEFQGKELDEVVITVPAGFNLNQKVSTHVAAELAGWKIVHLLSEPIAASITYFVHRQIPSNFNMLLFDLGGGTLDLCIFNIEKNKMKIVINEGDSNLGGRNFDNLLFEYFAQILETKYQIILNQRNKFRLMQKCVEIKHALSVENEASLAVDAFNSDIYEFLKISRQEFEILAVPLLKRMSEVLTKTFSQIEIFASDIDKVLLIGGGCRMPMIQQFLRNGFTEADHNCTKNPDEMVAIGAAYYSSFLMSKNGVGCNVM